RQPPPRARVEILRLAAGGGVREQGVAGGGGGAAPSRRRARVGTRRHQVEDPRCKRHRAEGLRAGGTHRQAVSRCYARAVSTRIVTRLGEATTTTATRRMTA